MMQLELRTPPQTDKAKGTLTPERKKVLIEIQYFEPFFFKKTEESYILFTRRGHDSVETIDITKDGDYIWHNETYDFCAVRPYVEPTNPADLPKRASEMRKFLTNGGIGSAQRFYSNKGTRFSINTHKMAKTCGVEVDIKPLGQTTHRGTRQTMYEVTIILKHNV